jgi:hypothetical protein
MHGCRGAVDGAITLGLDLVVLVLNDSAYGMIQWKARQHSPEADFRSGAEESGLCGELANSFGAHGHCGDVGGRAARRVAGGDRRQGRARDRGAEWTIRKVESLSLGGAAASRCTSCEQSWALIQRIEIIERNNDTHQYSGNIEGIA